LATGLAPGSTAREKKPKDQYIPVPTDAALSNVNCPICQEKFEGVWHDEAQEWVWMDAVKVGGRIYHATCLAEVSKNNSNPERLTPDPVLGKRKAEV
jgi:pre-mRNA cleavage complex 2 protein Pcf11